MFFSIILILMALGTHGQNTRDSSSSVRKLIIGVHGAPAGAIWLGGTSWSNGNQPILGFIAGGSVQYNLKQRFAICAELNYERKGNIGTYHDITGADMIDMLGDPNFIPGLSGTIKVKQVEDYITIPIIAQFKLNKKKIAWFANIGIFTAYLVRNGSAASEIEEPLGAVHYWWTLKDQHEIYFGLTTSVGANIPIQKRLQFLIEARNNLKLGNIFRYNQDESFALLLGIGYKI